jgi:arginyl-tRNA synthetase
VGLLVEKEAHELISKIATFPEVVAAACKQGEACTLVTYLMDLCHSISTAHHALWVLGREQPLAEARMLLFWAARVTLGNGLTILGLRPLERM